MISPKICIKKINGNLKVFINGNDVSDVVVKVWFDEVSDGSDLTVATIQFVVDSVEVENDIIKHLTTDVNIHDIAVSNLKKRAESKGMSNNIESRAITLNMDVRNLDAVKAKAEELITLIEKAKSCVDDLAQAELEIKIYD